MPERRRTRAGTGIPLLLPAIAACVFLLLSPAFIRPARGAAPIQKKKPAPKVEPRPDLPLEAILEKAAAYCAKLESAAFDFVCREEIAETIDPSLDVAATRSRPPVVTEYPGSTRYSGPTLVIRSIRKIKRSYVYDYQCVRAGRAIREVRTLLRESGKRKNVPNADLATSIIVFGNALLGPVGLFGERFRPSYDFAVAGEEKIGRTRVLIVDATPRPGAPPTRNLYGKAWIDPATSDILRIEWSENRVGHFGIFEERGRMFGRTPRLVIRSDFSAEKNGIRFPSRLVVEEAYLKESGKAFVRSKTEVVYTGFKFFTVETEVRDPGPSEGGRS
jgi:hypothetical protein